MPHLYSCATRGLLTAMLSTFSSSSDRSELNSSLHSTAQQTTINTHPQHAALTHSNPHDAGADYIQW